MVDILQTNLPKSKAFWPPFMTTKLADKSKNKTKKSFITCIDIIDVHENVESLKYEWNW